MNPSVSLVLPTFNEAHSIAQTIAEAIQFFDENAIPCEIIVAADGTDGTADIVQKLSQKDSRIKLFHSPERRGKGFGVREGILAATSDFVGFADADNKTPITEFPPFYAELKRGTPLVIGTRIGKGVNIEKKPPLYRRLGSRAFNHVVQLLLHLDGIPDTQCGFKFFQRDTARKLFSEQKIDGYMFDVEILSLARRQGLKIAQIPVRWRDDGDTRLELVRGNLRNARDILSIRFPFLASLR